MPDFRAYMLDKEGRIIARADIAAANLEEAKRHAFQIVSGKITHVLRPRNLGW
ncbi:MAG TPA: hypothetical protein VFL96_12275 [Acidobacteriaceae bacterium]|jgi:hypothetical protein|nr:hypothetical protein [Acidobacteriaceae bacterium]